MAKTKSVEVQMKQILDEYSDKVEDVLKKAAESTSDESASKLRNTSPKRYGDYAKSWVAERHEDGWIVRNREHYRLTHLLENGHVIRNKKGTYGRTSGIKHIKPVETWGNREFQRKIEEGLS